MLADLGERGLAEALLVFYKKYFVAQSDAEDVAWRRSSLGGWRKVRQVKWLFNIEALQDDFRPDIQAT